MTTTMTTTTTGLLARRDLNEEIEEASRRRAAEGGDGGGAGEVVAGTILGALVMGPFGALFGAQMGARLGARNALDRARKDEMERMGITEDMLKMAEEAGTALERSMDGLRASRDSLETLQRLARRLESDASDRYDRAGAAMKAGDEDEARRLLLDRTRIQDKLRRTLLSCAEEKRRVDTMQGNVEALEERALEIERLINRAIGSKSYQDSSLSLSSDDPLLQKFRDLGID